MTERVRCSKNKRFAKHVNNMKKGAVQRKKRESVGANKVCVGVQVV